MSDRARTFCAETVRNTLLIPFKEHTNQRVVITMLRLVKVHNVELVINIRFFHKGKFVRILPVDFIMGDDSFILEVLEEKFLVADADSSLTITTNVTDALDVIVTGEVYPKE
jgi:hypothetical protein